jgi:hypothetical protein
MGGFADLDHDGDLDLVFAGENQVYLNDGTGSFSDGPSVPTSGLTDPRAVGFADIDNDGDLDFAFGYKSSRNNMIRNNLDSGNWLKVELVSPDGQAGAFGAKTRIYPAGEGETGQLLGLRESRSNYGYLGQDDPVIHFGLGPRTSVDVVVTFLDGTRITRGNVAGNQKILVSGQVDDSTPPTTPTNVTALAESESQIGLSWTAASDPQSGVSFYAVYRNGANVGTTSQTQVTDSGLTEGTTYSYRVSATNGAGLEGPLSAPVNGTTLADTNTDTTPPALSNVSILNATTVSVLFSEPVEQASAQSPANYSIDLGIAVNNAALPADLRTVTLTTSPHAPGTTYNITVNNVRDRAANPNTILPNSQESYVFADVSPDLISYWTFDEGAGGALLDTVGTSHGTLVNMDTSASWVPGRQGTALHFDGDNDSVAISNFNPPHTGTITFWMNPDTVPSSGRQRIMGGNDAYELVLEGGEIHSQFFAGGSQDVESTSELTPGQWYHIAAAYDFTTTHSLEIFVNGVHESTSTFANDDPGGPFILSFGTRTGRTEYYQGTLDNVRLYGRVLSEAEVAQVMQEVS